MLGGLQTPGANGEAAPSQRGSGRRNLWLPVLLAVVGAGSFFTSAVSDAAAIRNPLSVVHAGVRVVAALRASPTDRISRASTTGSNGHADTARSIQAVGTRSAACHTDKIVISCTGTAVVHSAGKTVTWRGLICTNWDILSVTETDPWRYRTFVLSIPNARGGAIRDGRYRSFILKFPFAGVVYSFNPQPGSFVTVSHNGTRGTFRVKAWFGYLHRFSGSFHC